jgi:hypothetical protein
VTAKKGDFFPLKHLLFSRVTVYYPLTFVSCTGICYIDHWFLSSLFDYELQKLAAEILSFATMPTKCSRDHLELTMQSAGIEKIASDEDLVISMI